MQPIQNDKRVKSAVKSFHPPVVTASIESLGEIDSRLSQSSFSGIRRPIQLQLLHLVLTVREKSISSPTQSRRHPRQGTKVLSINGIRRSLLGNSTKAGLHLDRCGIHKPILLVQLTQEPIRGPMINHKRFRKGVGRIRFDEFHARVSEREIFLKVLAVYDRVLILLTQIVHTPLYRFRQLNVQCGSVR